MESDASELRQLESLCRAFYNGTPADQRNAHEFLMPLTADTRHIPQLQSVLAQSQDLHAVIFAANALTKLFTAHWSSIPSQQQDDTKKFLLNYLYQNGPSMVSSATVILQVYVRLLARLIKLSWLDNVGSKAVIDQIQEFLQTSTPHWIVGITIYVALTADMQPQSGHTVSRQRRAALAFKDSSLHSVAKVGVNTLQSLNFGTMRINESADERKLLSQVLELMNNCLSFDFMGIVPDETTDEQATVMIPQSWNFLKDPEICELFFSLYKKCWAATPPWTDCARLCLQCLILLAAVRRSFFIREPMRQCQISQLIEGTAGILQDEMGLQNDDCYHELCRLLGKINGANNFSDLVGSPGFDVWIERAFQFTMKALQDWQRLPNSMHYLLGLWSGMQAFRVRRPAYVERYISQVAVAYIESRMRIAECVASGDDVDLEDPLDNEVMRTEQLEAIGQLGRCRYQHTATYIAELFDRTNQEVQQGIIPKEVYQKKIAWIVYMIGSLVGGYTLMFTTGPPKLNTWLLKSGLDDDIDDYGNSSGNNNSPHAINGELATRTFRLMSETNTYEDIPEQLELAYIHFLDEFRKFLIFAPARSAPTLCSGICSRELDGNTTSDGEEASATPSATRTVKELLGLESEEAVFNLIVQKLIFNLQNRTKSEQVLKATLHLLMLLCSAMSLIHSIDRLPHLVMPGKLLLKDPTIQEVMSNHSRPEFTFLQEPKYAKYITSYYSSLARLLFLSFRMEEPRNAQSEQQRFTAFMEPLADAFNRIGQPQGGMQRWPATSELSGPVIKPVISRIARQLLGVVAACNSQESYALFFDWIVDRPRQPNNSKLDLLVAAVDACWDTYDVIIPLLKFFSELVYNKGQRITFDSLSANGVLLFKSTSAVLVSYGRNIMSKQLPVNTGATSSAAVASLLYREKYKGIAKALEMYGYALGGNYTNFGVFEVYNDRALADSLALALGMCLAIPNEDLQSFLRTLKSVYTFLEVVTRNFMPQVLSLQTSQLAAIIKTLEDGVCAFESNVVMQCCASLDHVVLYFFEKRDCEGEEGDAVKRFLLTESQCLKRVMQVIFQLIVSGEVTSTWSLSRPLLGLILLQESEFMAIRSHFTALPQINEEQRMKLNQSFQELMNGVEPNLGVKNKDTFTHNLFGFTHALKTTLV